MSHDPLLNLFVFNARLVPFFYSFRFIPRSHPGGALGQGGHGLVGHLEPPSSGGAGRNRNGAQRNGPSRGSERKKGVWRCGGGTGGVVWGEVLVVYVVCPGRSRIKRAGFGVCWIVCRALKRKPTGTLLTFVGFALMFLNRSSTRSSFFTLKFSSFLAK